MLVALFTALILCIEYVQLPFVVDIHMQSQFVGAVELMSFSQDDVYRLSFVPYIQPAEEAGDGTEAADATAILEAAILEAGPIGFIEKSRFSSSVFTIHGSQKYPIFAIDLKNIFHQLTSMNQEPQEIFLPTSIPQMTEKIYNVPYTGEVAALSDHQSTSQPEPITGTRAFVRFNGKVFFLTLPEFDIVLTVQQK